MAKPKTIYFCQNCGFESAKWMGQCPGCRQWNTFTEEKLPDAGAYGSKSSGRTRDLKPVAITGVRTAQTDRIRTGIGELDRVLGGGLVRGSLVLVGGDPGIGKSTLLLQVCQKLSQSGVLIWYISGEESMQQIRIRADRIGSFSDSLKLLCETNLNDIAAALRKEKPKIVVIDSIQTMYHPDIPSAPGSVSQVREATGVLMRLAKSEDISIFVVGHVTKEGTVAGPRVLEHMVDTVLYFEGDRHASYRILRGVKNRFGSTNEIGVFEMSRGGLQEVTNPSEFLLNGRPQGASGSIVACSIEGTRPILAEVQALVSRTGFNFPRRTAAGADLNRVNLIMAVLEKRAGLRLSEHDAYINIAGGIRMNEPALDLGIALAIASSCRNIPLAADLVCFGEIGLGGEIRAVSMTAQRVHEAAKLGFRACILPRVSIKEAGAEEGIMLLPAENIAQAIRLATDQSPGD